MNNFYFILCILYNGWIAQWPPPATFWGLPGFDPCQKAGLDLSGWFTLDANTAPVGVVVGTYVYMGWEGSYPITLYRIYIYVYIRTKHGIRSRWSSSVTAEFLRPWRITRWRNRHIIEERHEVGIVWIGNVGIEWSLITGVHV